MTGPLRVFNKTVAAWGQRVVNSASSLAVLMDSLMFASAAATSIFWVLCAGAPGATNNSRGAGPRRAARLAIVKGVVGTASADSTRYRKIRVRVLERPHEAPRALASVADDWWPAVTANWKLWIPAQLVNFAIVPLHFQVLFANGVALVWNTYLSHITHRS